jgi:prophage DNA circulation protein
MSWRDEYQPGSFRGVPFRSQNHETTGGRRVVTHEYPGRDKPSTEDLGSRAKTYQLDCHVLGDGYFADRNALADALDAEGPGELVHPWLGSMQVVVLDRTFTESTEAGGIAYFSVVFGEAGIDVATPEAIDGKSRVAATARSVDDAAPVAFAEEFDVSGMPAFVETAAGDIVSAAVDLTQFSAGVGGGVGPALRTFEASLKYLPDSISTLIRTPLALGQSVHAMVLAVELLDRTARSKTASFYAMTDFDSTIPAVVRTTPARKRQADNRDALVHLFTVTSAASMVRAASNIQFASYDEAVALRDRLSDRLDNLALASADAGHDDRACAFDSLRHAMVRDIGQRGGSLQRVYHHRLSITEPALVIANRLYGHKGVAEQADDLALRNKVRHPGFVPGGNEISVLEAAE